MGRGEVRDLEKAANIIRDAGGRVVGRTRLQKVAFLLELAGMGEGFGFEYRHYGPYSEQLADAVSAAARVGLISEEERPTAWGGSYSIFTVPSRPTGDEPGARIELIRKTEAADPIALELAATAAFLAKEGEADPWGETARRKPEKADRLDQAESLYRELLAVPTPSSLPSIPQQGICASTAPTACVRSVFAR
jgi:uncharacterized protein